GGTVYDFIGSPVNDYIADGYLIDKDATATVASSTTNGSSNGSSNGSTVSTIPTASVYGNATITLANGTTELASQITPGTMVLSYNLVTHKLQPSMISAVVKLTASNRYVFNGKLNVDSNEIMFINGKWQRAYQAKVGDVLFDPLTGKNITITSIQVFNKGGTVYDFIGSPVNDYIADGYLIDKDSTV
ncbi:MAG: hypothetical protein ACP5MK_02050, partial [Candidatus Micrarchaeia archaeon]